MGQSKLLLRENLCITCPKRYLEKLVFLLNSISRASFDHTSLVHPRGGTRTAGGFTITAQGTMVSWPCRDTSLILQMLQPYAKARDGVATAEQHSTRSRDAQFLDVWRTRLLRYRLCVSSALFSGLPFWRPVVFAMLIRWTRAKIFVSNGASNHSVRFKAQ